MSDSNVQGRVAALAFASLFLAPMFATADSAPPAGKAFLGVAAEANESGSPGVTIRGVRPESPAGRAGLEDGDRIVQAGDRQVKSFDDLRNALAGHKPGDKLALKVERDGKEQSLNVTLGAEPRHEARGSTASEKPAAILGVFTQPLSADVKEHMKLKVDHGALVAQVMPGSPAAKAGLAELDVITRANDTAINSPQELRQAVEKAGPGKELTLKIARGDKTMEVKAKLGEEAANRFFDHEQALPEMPEGFGKFQSRMPHFFAGPEKVSELEKRVHELESRIDQLEKNQGKPAGK
jgi:S1-C subfamily serine protease